MDERAVAVESVAGFFTRTTSDSRTPTKGLTTEDTKGAAEPRSESWTSSGGAGRLEVAKSGEQSMR